MKPQAAPITPVFQRSVARRPSRMEKAVTRYEDIDKQKVRKP